jgi:predicted O-methyltransferase YrrM
MLRHRFRLIFNGLIAFIPQWMLTGFFKTFTSKPELAEAAGFHVHPCRFDSPLPLMKEIDWPKLNLRRALPGIDFREADSLKLVKQLGRWTAELDSIPYSPDGQSVYWFENGTFTDFDAAALYSLLRELKPKRYVELGCGWSSFISSRALAQNEKDGSPCRAIYADPVPRRDLNSMLATGEFLAKRVQEVPAEIFNALEAGDVLFIDTSHVLKIQSDVEYELLHILPLLKPGVWIHVHDVFSPYDYPEEYVRMQIRLTWNEQYAVECLLTGGDRYRVELPLHLLWRNHRSDLQPLFPRGQTRPQSFWMSKSGAGQIPLR